MDEINSYLREHARLLWEMQRKDVGFTVAGYSLNGHPIVVQRFGDGNGMEVYLPTPNSVALTLDALRRLE